MSQAAAAGGHTPALFAAIGDFNQDGLQDVVVEGTVPGDSALDVVAVLNGSKATAIQVACFPVFEADAKAGG